MSVDLDAIRRRVQELTGQRKNSLIQLWKPEVGEYRVRGLPNKFASDGLPIVERHFYYIGNNRGIVAPFQFGKPDPINDLIRKLYSSGKPEDRLLAKKLRPNMSAFLPVIVRGQEDKGVQVWKLNRFTYQRVLSFFTDEDGGDILNPNDGFDMKVTLINSAKKVDGKSFLEATVDIRRPSKLSEDPELVKKWIDAVPNIDDIYKQQTAAEIEVILNNWLSTGNKADEQPVGSDGSSRGSEKADVLDQLADDLKTKPVEKKEDKPVKKSVAKKALPALDEEEPVATTTGSTSKKALDDAFAELMEGEED